MEEQLKNVILFCASRLNINANQLNTYFDLKPICHQVIKKEKKISWLDKKNILIWRGTPSDAGNYKNFGLYNLNNWIEKPRGKLCYLSKLYPNLIDAKFINGKWDIKSEFPNPLDLPKIIPLTDKFLLPKEHLTYKYQICLDGVTCTYPSNVWKLLSGSVTFKQNSKYVMWFYKALKPWVHYIPIKHDLSDLIEKINWAIEHDEEAKQIAENAQSFAKENLLEEHLMLYCYKVLKKYASLQKWKVKLQYNK